MQSGINRIRYNIFLFSESPSILVVGALGLGLGILRNSGPNISLTAAKERGIVFDNNTDPQMMDNVNNMIAAVAATQPSR